MASRTLLGGFAVLACAAVASCGGSTTAAPTPATPSQSPSQTSSQTPSQTPSQPGGGDVGCLRATVKGQTKSVQLQALATTVYQSLNCSSTQPVMGQLEAASKDPELAKKVADIGGTMSTTAVTGAFISKFMVVDPTSTSISYCSVEAYPSQVKSLVCQDV